MPLKNLARLLASTLLIVATIGCNASVNKSIRVADGEKVSGGLNSVNGSITIGNGASVSGSSKTVNGRIRVKDGAKVSDLITVNGSVDVGANSEVDGDLTSVNGSVECESGTKVDGDVQTVNGSIDLEGTNVRGGLETHNGSIRLQNNSRVSRDVVIERVDVGSWKKGSSLEIHLSGGSVIEGDIIVRNKNRPVQVIVDATSEIKGEIRGAELVKK